MTDDTRSMTPPVKAASPRPASLVDPDPSRPHANPGPDAGSTRIRADHDATRIRADPDATRTPTRARADVDVNANAGPMQARADSGLDPSAAHPASHPASNPSTFNALPPAITLPGATHPGGPPIRQVGRYLIGERLGRGGMATVFKAHDPQIDRDVAIKFLHPNLCEDEECHSRFLREARAAGSLSHPNIVTVHDVGEIEGRPYMAMELLDGRPLADEMNGGRSLPVRESVVMAIQLANALAYAHARRIVHRDIKPGNLLRVAGSSTIKVTDFGIAHMDSAGAAHRTRVGDILGTPQYMSPEQAQGERLDGRSDLFSTGILLYQMLTGQRPFQGDSLVTLALKIAKDDPVPIEQLRPDLPASLRRVVARCLAKAPDRRFQTGQELADALGRVLAELDEAERAKAKSRLVPLRVKWAGMMALIVAAVMALTTGVVYQRQYAAMLNQAVDSGSALARFIGAQNAAAVLGGDEWDSVDVAIKEIMRTGDFHDIAIVDREGTVRAANDSARIGRPFVAPPSKVVQAAGEGAEAVVTRRVEGGAAVLGFEAPITFNGKHIGRVVLGLPERPLAQVAKLSLALMAILVVVTVLAVAVAMYFVADWFAKPIRLVGDSMDEIAKGRFDQRIREQRNDEFGELYAAFDRMAQALQDRQGAAAVPLGAAPASATGATAAPLAPPAPAAAAIPAPEAGPDAESDATVLVNASPPDGNVGTGGDDDRTAILRRDDADDDEDRTAIFQAGPPPMPKRP